MTGLSEISLRKRHNGRWSILFTLPLFFSACAQTSQNHQSAQPLPGLEQVALAQQESNPRSAGSTIVHSDHQQVDEGVSPAGNSRVSLNFEFAHENPDGHSQDRSADQLNTPQTSQFETSSDTSFLANSSSSSSVSNAKTLKGLTLADLETMALESNPTLDQLAAVVEKARGIRDQSDRYPNPVVGYNGTEIGNEGAAGQQGAFVSQTIVTGDKLRLNRHVASWNIQEMSWAYQVQKYRVLNDVRLQFYDLLGAQKRLEITARLMKVAQNGLKIARQLKEAKQAAQADVLMARRELNLVRILQQNAEFDRQTAWKRLTLVLGRPNLAMQDIQGALSGSVRKWNWEATSQRLLEESPQLESARARVQGARTAIQRQEVQTVPNVLAQLGVAYDASTRDPIANVQVGVPLPLYNKNRGNIRLAHGEYQRAIRNVERLELQLRDQLAIAFRQFQQAQFQVNLYETSILKDVAENLRLTEASYEAGQVNFTRVLTARRAFFESNLKYVDALIALQKANVILNGFVLTGGLTDVPDIGSRALSGAGQRGQALSGQ